MSIQVLSSSAASASTPISFRELAKTIPARRQGRPVCVSTLHRWRTHGLQGIKLEAIRIGGSWYSSLAAFEQFCEAITAARTTPGIALPSPGKASEAAVDVALAGLGYK